MSGQIISIDGLFPKVLPKEHPELKAALEKFVFGVSRDLLKRNPTFRELNDTVYQIFRGMSRKEVALLIASSCEQYGLFIKGVFQRFLHSTPSEEAVDHWIDVLKNGASREDVMAEILGSADYYNHCGNNHHEYVQTLHRSLYGREVSPAELQSWVAFLNSETASRRCVAQTMLSTHEYHEVMVKHWYQTLLNREPNEESHIFCMDLLRSGKGQEQVVAAIISGRDYFTHVIMKYCAHDLGPLT